MWSSGSEGGMVQLLACMLASSLQASGAYIFRPNGTAPFPINPGNVATVTVVKVTEHFGGELFVCVHCGSCSVVFVDPLIGRPCSGSAASVLPMGQPGRCGEGGVCGESGVCEGWVEGGVCVERCV